MHQRIHQPNHPKFSLLPLINALYERIRALEMEHALFAGATDYRPRIELFHDAIRALVAGDSPYETKGRLTLERLEWDINTLRMIQGNPLMKMAGAQQESASQALTVMPQSAKDARSFNRAVRTELAENYKNYTVLFVALLAETADMNHQSRIEEQDALLGEIASLNQSLAGKVSVNLHQLVTQVIHDDYLAEILKKSLPNTTMPTAQAKQSLKQMEQKIDAKQEKLELSHINWLSQQRASYEEGKSIVQQTLQMGLNIAGAFLQATLSGKSTSGRGF
jgi:hypothetical protein